MDFESRVDALYRMGRFSSKDEARLWLRSFDAGSSLADYIYQKANRKSPKLGLIVLGLGILGSGYFLYRQSRKG